MFNQLSYFSIKQTSCQILNGGDEEIRTPDPLLARQVLSQLSYAPMSGYALVSIIHSEESVIFLKLYLCLALLSVLYTMCISSNMSQLVGLGGLEPPTSRLSGVRSNQLSYRPISVDLRVFTDLSKPNNVRCQSVDLSDIQALGSVYVSLERR